MIVHVSLHTHSAASDDGSLPMAAMDDAYQATAPYVTAVTDHDTWSTPRRRTQLAGIEHTLDAERYLHVVELGNGFTFLAHPSLPFPDRTRDRAAAFARDHGLDGVEKYNRGCTEYHGRISGVVELANDDAHNPSQIGLSYMTVDVTEVSEQTVMRAIRRGDFQRHTQPNALRELVGGIRQGLQLGIAGWRRRNVLSSDPD